MNFEIIKICKGAAHTHHFNGKPKRTAYFKTPIESRQYVSKLGLEGDEQVYKDHGGINKAICLYDQLDYQLWEPFINDMPKYAAFGENITTVGLTKGNIAIGDTFKFGEAIIQVTESRGPCNTIAQVHNVPNIVKLMAASHATGCYFRVLKEGFIEPDSHLTLIDKHSLNFTIEEFNTLKYTDKKNRALLEKALKVDALPEEHLIKFQGLFERL